MSGIATSAGRNPAIVTGIVGMMLGLALGIGFAGVVLSIDARGVATSDGGGVALTQAQVAEALRAHVAREYGGLATGVSSATTAELQRQHVAREYGAASRATAAELLRQHLAREYGTASGGPSGATVAQQLFEHTLRESAAP